MVIQYGVLHEFEGRSEFPIYKPSRIQEDLRPIGFSDLEWLVFKELQKRHISFVFQVNIAGGQGFIGGQRVDFYLTDRPVIIRVMGYYHEVPGAPENDYLGRAYLEGQGYQVIDLYTYDIETDLAGALDRELGVSIPI